MVWAGGACGGAGPTRIWWMLLSVGNISTYDFVCETDNIFSGYLTCTYDNIKINYSSGSCMLQPMSQLDSQGHHHSYVTCSSFFMFDFSTRL